MKFELKNIINIEMNLRRRKNASGSYEIVGINDDLHKVYGCTSISRIHQCFRYLSISEETSIGSLHVQGSDLPESFRARNLVIEDIRKVHWVELAECKIDRSVIVFTI